MDLKAESRRQKAEGRRQKAENPLRVEVDCSSSEPR
jgi:hypothetical protein